jgi:hypothetical protein
VNIRALSVLCLSQVLWGWSPTFHEVQSKLAARMVPRPLAELLQAQREVFLEAARGVANDEPPTVEQVEDQYTRILRLSEASPRPRQLARELGILAHMVQALADPGATYGVSALREQFTAYGDDNLGRMVLTREPVWALDSDGDPRPRLLIVAREKFDRHRALLDHFDQEKSRRIGEWDELSIPFAQLQLSFSGGIHATANLWILLWRAVGERWPESGLKRVHEAFRRIGTIF